MAKLQSGTRVYGNTSIDTFITVGANASITGTTNATSNSTGTLTVAGGVGIKGNVFTGSIYITGTSNNLTFVDGTTLSTSPTASISAAFTQANTANTVAIASYVQANTATIIGQAAYVQANTANTVAIASYVQANAATIIGQAAYVQANTSNTVAIAAYVQANTATIIGQAAFARANSEIIGTAAYVQANTATIIGQAAYIQANTSNTVAIAAYVKANTSNTVAIASYVQANTANTVAISAYAQANTATIIAQAAYNQANVGGTAIDQTARTTANNAYNQANVATIIAQAAYAQANTGGGGGSGTDAFARTQANLALLKANTGSITGSDSITIGINAGYYNDSNSTSTIAIGNNAGQGIIVTTEYVSGGIGNDYFLWVTSANGIFKNAKVYGTGYTGKGFYVGEIANNTTLTLYNSDPNVALPDSSNGTLTFVMNQQYESVAIGTYAGQMNQGYESVAIGSYAGQYNLTPGGIAIGLNAGIGVPEIYRTYVSGGLLGNTTVMLDSNSNLYKGMYIFDINGELIGQITYVNPTDGVSIDVGTGLYMEPVSSFLKFRHQPEEDAGTVAIGKNSGAFVQGYAAIAVGKWAGQFSQSQGAAAFGWHAGEVNQEEDAIGIGHEAGYQSQGERAIAIGSSAGGNTQGSYSISIGNLAGNYRQGSYSIAIGNQAGENSQSNNSIILNATGDILEQTIPGTLTVAPIRNDVSNTANVLYYNIETKEITYAPPAGGSFGTDSWARIQANTAFDQANTATIIAQAAYNQANVGGTSIDQTARTIANTAYARANSEIIGTAAYVQANTATTIGQAAFARANSEIIGTAAYVQANTATIIAQASYSTANLKFNTSGGIITGNTTINANLIVTGANVSLGNVGNVHIYGGNTGQILITDGQGNINWTDLPSPNTTTYTANSLIQTNGVYVSGNLWSTQVFGDYLSANGAYVLTDGSGTAPAWYIDFDFINVVKFNRVVLNINYTQNSGHTIYVQLYNNLTTAWDNIGTYTGLGSYYAFALEVIDEADYVSSGRVQLRLYHSNAGNTGHQTSIDYVALEQSIQGPQGPRGPTGATGATGATGNGVATGGTTGQVLIKNSATDYDTAWSSNLIYSFNTGNSAFIQANTATIIAQASFARANSEPIGTAAYIQANTATIIAQAAYAKANTGGGGGSSLGLITATVLGWNLP